MKDFFKTRKNSREHELRDQKNEFGRMEIKTS